MVATGCSLLLGMGEEGVGNECVSSLREAMKSLRWRYALADLFGLVLASASFWTKVVAIQ